MILLFLVKYCIILFCPIFPNPRKDADMSTDLNSEILGSGTPADEADMQPPKQRRWPKWLLFVLVVGLLLFVALALTMGFLTSSSLQRSIENAGFNNVVVFPADETKQTIESATANYGSCQLRFIIATQELPGGQGVIERLAVVESDGGLLFDTTPTELASMERYAPCTQQ